MDKQGIWVEEQIMALLGRRKNVKKGESGFDRKVITFAEAIGDVYRIERERGNYPKLELCEDALTEDFTAMLWAQMVLYKRVTGEKDMDILGFIGTLNRLAVQRLMDGGQLLDGA